MLQLITEIHKGQQALHAQLAEHMIDVKVGLAAAITKLMTESFPEGDPSAHRKLHEEANAAAKAKTAFWQKLLFEITKYGLIGLIGWVAITAWQAFLHGPKP